MKIKIEVEATYFNLEPGVYEIIVDGVFLAKDLSTYLLTRHFFGIDRLDNKVISAADNKIEVVNMFSAPANYNLKGQITGYEIYHDVTISGSNKFSMPFVLRQASLPKSLNLK